MTDLRAALARVELNLPDDQVEALDRYRGRLWEMNEKLNLTRHTDYDRFAGRDVLDTMRLARHIDPGDRVLDVGTGGGVPGVILSILRPDLRVVLCESVGKRARAVASIVESLDIDVPVLHARAEDVLADRSFETLVARAVAPLPKLLTWLAPHFDAVGQLLVFGGQAWTAQRAEARHLGLMQGLELRKVDEYATPAGDHPSVILRVRAQG
jgi:16S rRNA (guanine527-N7)-methyltransferase